MAKIKNKLSYLLALLAPIFAINTQADDEPKSAGSEEKAVEAASGSLSAGAIAAAVAASGGGRVAVADFDGYYESLAGSAPFTNNNVVVTYYPMLVTKQLDIWPENKKRERHWALLKDAKRLVDRADYANLIEQFDTISPWVLAAAKHNTKVPPK